MPRLKLTFEYDGTDYVGWQVQPNGRSIQSVVEGALQQLLGERVSVAAAGRTDAGVHALGQVAAFSTTKSLPIKAFVKGLTILLPDDIAVVAAEEVPDTFDARRWSLGKRYRYLINNRPSRSPMLRRTHWLIFRPLDVEAMTRAARALVGRHDFSAFRAADCAATNAIRQVTSLALAGSPGGEIVITLDGTAFLKHMVRNIVGSLVEVGKGRHPPEWIGEVLAQRDRTRAGPTAPAHGLTLVHVLYGDGPRKGSVKTPPGSDLDDE